MYKNTPNSVSTLCLKKRDNFGQLYFRKAQTKNKFVARLHIKLAKINLKAPVFSTFLGACAIVTTVILLRISK